MKTKFLICLLLAFWLLPLASPDSVVLAATTVQLSGAVREPSSTAVAGARVDALGPGSGTILASATTGPNGAYSMAVAAGTYDIQVTPPATSAGQPVILLNQSLARDTLLDFVLTPNAGSLTFSGAIRDNQGNGVPYVYVSMNPTGAYWGSGGSTDANGYYSLQVNAGKYDVYINGNNSDLALNVPGNFDLSNTGVVLSANPLAITQNTILNMTVPARQVRVHVQNAAGSAVANVGLNVGGADNPDLLAIGGVILGGSSSYSFYKSSFSAASDCGAPPCPSAPNVTDANGDATLWLFQTSTTPTCPYCGVSNYSFTAVPPDGSGYGATNLSNVALTGDASLNMTLNNAVTLSGAIHDNQGNGVPYVSVDLYPQNGGISANGSTDAGGSYAIQLGAGSYAINVNGSNADANMRVPGNFNLSNSDTSGAGTPLALAQNTTLDITLPVRRLSVHVQDSSGKALSNIGLQTAGPFNPNLLTVGSLTLGGSSSYWFFGGLDYCLPDCPPQLNVTDAAGNASLWLFPTASTPPCPGCPVKYTLTAIPPNGSNYSVATVSDIAVSADSSVVITLSPPLTLNGNVRDNQGAGVPNVSYYLNPVNGGLSVNGTTDANGYYSVQLAAGPYNPYMTGSNSNVALRVPGYFDLSNSNALGAGTPLQLSQNTTLDYTLPVRRVSVHVQDSNGNPVGNVGLRTNGAYNANLMTVGGTNLGGSSSYAYFAGALDACTPDCPPMPNVTDANGNATLWLFPTATTPPCVGCAVAKYIFTAVPPSGSPFTTRSFQNIEFTADATLVFDIQAGQLVGPPVISAAPVISRTLIPAPNAAGWNNSDVTVSWTVTDLKSTVVSTAGCNPTTLTGDTAGTSLTCSATNAVPLTGALSVMLKLDKTAPEIAATATLASGAPFAAGTWTNTDVTVGFGCRDALSGVTFVSEPSTVSTEGLNQSRSGSCSDLAGNVAGGTASGINIDKTAPVIAAAATLPDGTPYTAGNWTNKDVTVTFTCSDALSGVASVSAPTKLTGEGADQSATGTCTDRAGNSAKASFGNIDLDKTAPVIAAKATLANGSPYTAGTWTNQSVTVHFDCADGGSGLASCSADQTIANEGVTAAVNGSATDKAGNSSKASFGPVQIDKAPPAIAASAKKADGSAYSAGTWTNQNVTVRFKCSDGGSGIASCPADVVLSSEGKTALVSGTATDKVGSSSSASFGPVQIDKTPPAVTRNAAADQCSLPGANGWCRATQSAAFSASDALSGLANAAQANFAQATAINGGSVNIASGPVCDTTGNCNPGINAGPFKLDSVAPGVACVSPAPAFTLNQTGATVSANVTDATSGAASATVSAAVSTSKSGSFTQVLIGMDNAGNSATQPCAYKVGYGWGGFFAPVANPPVLNPFKAGKDIEVKFSLGGDQGLTIFAPNSPASQQIDCQTRAVIGSATPTKSSVALKYDASSNRYTYTWQTDKAWKGTCRQLILTLNDGTQHIAYLDFDKSKDDK